MGFVRRASVISIFVCAASPVFAAPITYTFSGTASGTLGGTAFTNAVVQETAIGDTAGIVNLQLIASGNSISVFVEPVNDITITIAGLGATSVTDLSEMLSVPTPQVIASGFPDLPYVVLGTLDNPPALGSLTGYGAIGSNALLGYNLASSFGPLTASPGGVGYPAGLVVHTTKGDLSFAQNVDPSAQGTFAAATPEPGGLVILGSGIVLLGCRLRRFSGR